MYISPCTPCSQLAACVTHLQWLVGHMSIFSANTTIAACYVISNFCDEALLPLDN